MSPNFRFHLLFIVYLIYSLFPQRKRPAKRSQGVKQIQSNKPLLPKIVDTAVLVSETLKDSDSLSLTQTLFSLKVSHTYMIKEEKCTRNRRHIKEKICEQL